MKCIEVKTDPSYNVWIGSALTSQIGKLLYPIASGHRVAMITDMYVDPLYGEEVIAAIEDYGIEVQSFPIMVEEKTKNLSTVETLLRKLTQENYSKDDVILDVGGGMISDIAGMTAALFLSGIKVVHMPSTLLAMTDAAIGGKAELNLPEGKGIVGTVYQPELVVADIDMLATLPEHEIRSGMGEIMKYSVLEDSGLYNKLLNHPARTDLNDLENIIWQCAQIKAHIVEDDPAGFGNRGLVRLGHTAGQAIEAATDYSILHGEAVGLGMLVMAYGTGNRKTGDKIKALLEKYDLPTTIEWPDREIISAALFKGVEDRNYEGTYSIVVPEAIGHCVRKKVSARELTLILKKGLVAIKHGKNQSGKRHSLRSFRRARS